MRRVLSILLLLCFVSTGTGLSEDLHRAQHELEHAHATSEDCHHHDGDGEQREVAASFNADSNPAHTDAHCQICLNVRVTAWAGYTYTAPAVADAEVARHTSVDSQCDRPPFLLQIETTGPPAC